VDWVWEMLKKTYSSFEKFNRLFRTMFCDIAYTQYPAPFFFVFLTGQSSQYSNSHFLNSASWRV
jgi:hypothetical protein